MRHVVLASRTKPGQRDMGREFPRIGRQADALADPLDLGLQGEELGTGAMPAQTECGFLPPKEPTPTRSA